MNEYPVSVYIRHYSHPKQKIIVVQYYLNSAKIKGIKRLIFYAKTNRKQPVNLNRIFTSFSCQKVYFSVFPNITCMHNLLN